MTAGGTRWQELPAERIGHADRLKLATADLHRTAESTHFMRRLLRREATPEALARFLRGLLPAYEALEEGLAGSERLQALARPEIYRADAIRTDLRVLAGYDWSTRLPLTREGIAFADRVRGATLRPPLLAAHAYTRFLGDLNGGRILARALAATPALAGTPLAVFAYPALASVSTFARAYREAIDAVALEAELLDSLIEEGRVSFACSIAIAESIDPSA